MKTLLFFWDYDTQWGADRSRLPGPKDWGRLEFENTDRLLELHERYQAPACFAVVGAAARPGSRPYSDPAQIRRIHHMGHEIASHSLYHDWLPGLNERKLIQTLKESKDQLEQCVGAPVQAFVPPYNQPFDYPRRGSFSLSERREAGPERTDLPALCRALRETGYAFCRVSYRTPIERIKHMLNLPNSPYSTVEEIAEITCLRLSNPAGFNSRMQRALEAKGSGTLIAYGHPHSLRMGGAQDEKYLVPFLERVREQVSAGRLRVIQPRHLLAEAGRGL